jgi:hypothetical protein
LYTTPVIYLFFDAVAKKISSHKKAQNAQEVAAEPS